MYNCRGTSGVLRLLSSLGPLSASSHFPKHPPLSTSLGQVQALMQMSPRHGLP